MGTVTGLWGCSQEVSSNKLSGQEKVLSLKSRIQAGCVAQEPAWDGQELTRHKPIWLVPFIFIVMQCPEIDDHMCVLRDGKLSNANPDEETRKGRWSAPQLHLGAGRTLPHSQSFLSLIWFLPGLHLDPALSTIYQQHGHVC